MFLSAKGESNVPDSWWIITKHIYTDTDNFTPSDVTAIYCIYLQLAGSIREQGNFSDRPLIQLRQQLR